MYCKALADPTRIRLLHILYRHELSVNEIVSVLGMGQSRISRHLRILTEAELLVCRRDGVWAFYGLPDKGKGRDFLMAIQGWIRSEKFSGDLAKAAEILEARRKSTSRFFDAIAGDWGSLKKEILGDFDLNGKILEFSGTPRLAVDLGCGTGELLRCLAGKAQTLVGVDYSVEMLAKAQKNCEGAGIPVDLRLGAIEHLPVADGLADLAVLSLALHHLPDPERGVRDAARILVPGGRLLIADFDKHEDESLRERFGDRWLGFSRENIARFLDKAGFRLEASHDFPLVSSLTLVLYCAVKI